ncbi:MAG: hypothetical protein GY845_00950 [Planctomycetes bacterium]|nr:hypothetical protein [Planctomycetota bacterium]
MAKADIGLIGLAVMGENLILNMESKGFTVACFNRTVSKVDDFMKCGTRSNNIIGCHSIEELAQQVKKPRKIMITGNCLVGDDIMYKLLPHLDNGDIIIDGVKCPYSEAIRRCDRLKKEGILYIATCVYTNHQMTQQGLSMAPDWSPEILEQIESILQEIGIYSDHTHSNYNHTGESTLTTYAKPLSNNTKYKKYREGLRRRLLMPLQKVFELKIEKHREVTTTWKFNWHPTSWPAKRK